jgi:hypothetical protein
MLTCHYAIMVNDHNPQRSDLPLSGQAANGFVHVSNCVKTPKKNQIYVMGRPTRKYIFLCVDKTFRILLKMTYLLLVGYKGYNMMDSWRGSNQNIADLYRFPESTCHMRHYLYTPLSITTTTNTIIKYPRSTNK